MIERTHSMVNQINNSIIKNLHIGEGKLRGGRVNYL